MTREAEFFVTILTLARPALAFSPSAIISSSWRARGLP
jgi:hypothetical protein